VISLSLAATFALSVSNIVGMFVWAAGSDSIARWNTYMALLIT
jgi:hypothetical protein